jgi:hypothetical protein
MLHELAEGLQASGSYLAALHHKFAADETLDDATREILERTLSQWARACHASHELQTLLSGPPPSDTQD